MINSIAASARHIKFETEHDQMYVKNKSEIQEKKCSAWIISKIRISKSGD